MQLTQVKLSDSDSIDKDREKLIRSIAESATSGKEFTSYQLSLIEQADIVQ